MSNNTDSVFPSQDKEERMDPVVMEGEKEGGNSETGWSEELRLVLIGMTGSGKSASGNTILGQRKFLSKISASSVTQICELGSTVLTEEEIAEEDGQAVTRRKKRRVTVVDMPGFGDTHLTVEQIHAEIAKCVCLTAPGPHAFLLVVPLGRYTDNENRAVREVAKLFGEDAVRHHTVVLFTRGDDLEDMGIEEYLRKTVPAGLNALIDRCGGRYHVLNNRDPSNLAQVKELLMKVDKMLKQTNRGFYTNTMFLEAEAAIMEEQKRMLRERGEAEGEEGGNNGSMEGQANLAKKRKCDPECDRTGSSEKGSKMLSQRQLDRGNDKDFRVERWTKKSRGNEFSLLQDQVECRDQFRGRRRSSKFAISGRQGLCSSLNRITREAALSPKVLERVKIMVAAGTTGLAVGALFGAAAPLAAAAGASLLGNSVGLAAGHLTGMSVAGSTSVGSAVGAIVTAATGRTAVALGAATGGVIGGSLGAIVGSLADSPGEGALDALGQVSTIGACAVGVAAGMGGTLGAGAALGTALEGAAFSMERGAETTAVAAGSVAQNMETASNILFSMTEIGKAAVRIALAGSLVVKVVKEKVRFRTGTRRGSYSEKKSYEIYWNK